MKGCRSLTDQEIDSVFNTLNNPRDKALWILGVKTGLRISELLSLRIEDILEHDSIANFVTVKKSNTKGKIESKTLPLTSSAKAALKELLDYVGFDQTKRPLFKSSQGEEAISRMQAHRILKSAYSELKLSGKCATHTMRKSFAHRVHKVMGEKIEKTQVALGHKSLSSTSNYIQVNRDEVERAIMGLG